MRASCSCSPHSARSASRSAPRSRRARSRAHASREDVRARVEVAVAEDATLVAKWQADRECRRSTCEAIAAERPALETLELRTSYFERWSRHGPDPRTLDATWLVPILRPEIVPRLREFAVASTYNTDVVCTALATSPLAAQLTQLALIEGQFTEVGIAALARPGFPALQWLRLSGLGPATARTRLEHAAPRRVIELRLDDDPDNEDY